MIDSTNNDNSITTTSTTEEMWIVDTDYSLDDQLVLPYLLNKLNIIAVTVCGTNTENPIVIKKKIEDDLVNKYSKKDIKVFAGADRPYINYQVELKDEAIFDTYNYYKTDYSAFKEIENKENSEKVDIGAKIANIAAVKITEYVRIHEKKLNILTLGPLTNISLAVLIDSTIRDKFNNLFIVGGSYNNLGNSGTSAEYNFRADPVAAKNVINYYKNITLFPYELEEQLKLAQVEKIEGFEKIYPVASEILNILNQETEENRMKYSLLGLFGGVIVANLEKCTKVKKMRPCDIDIIGRYTRGAMAIEKYDHIKSGKFNEICIIEDVDVEAFAEIIKSML